MAKSKKEIQQEYLKRTGYAANSKYNKERTVVLGVRMVMATEGDIIRRLEEVGNKAGYVKRLIREDMAREREGKDDGA